MLNAFVLRKIVERALQEDVGSGDVTTELLLEPTARADAIIRAKESCIIAGLPVAQMVFQILDLDRDLQFSPKVRDGERVGALQGIAEINGSLRAILTGERTALNFLQRMSGIATQTARFVEAVKSYPAQILDTRKTAPGLRMLDKYAVRVGGGRNHRIGLYDGVMIKSNHIRAREGITEAIERARVHLPATLKIEVEVQNLEEFQEALCARVDIIMLDNMSPKEMKEAVSMRKEVVLLEASGGVTLENVREIAATGVDFISVGTLTHSVRAIDMHLEVRTT